LSGNFLRNANYFFLSHSLRILVSNFAQNGDGAHSTDIQDLLDVVLASENFAESDTFYDDSLACAIAALDVVDQLDATEALAILNISAYIASKLRAASAFCETFLDTFS
jgi:hypothetical protein